MRAFDAIVRVAGACVAATLGAMTALLEAFATPYHWAIPVSAALAGNLLLFWFAQYTVAKSWAWLVPTVPWFLVMFVAVGSTSEGDLIANSWIGLATFGAGAVGFLVPAALPIRPPIRPPKSPSATPLGQSMPH
ncbi:MAG TPA: hypothetical protein VFC19_48975 [Candidatus Limnocylindrales bacterium]|nr:hypothetical protein [Candidatus Limnocylindrales bacterium]